MIDWIVSFALRKRLVVAMICIFAAVYGYYSWTQLAIEAYPDVADTASQVVTQAPGLAAEEVEQQVTIPLERELNGTPGLAMMRSRSTFGLSLITLVFRDGIEDYWSRQRITERIQDVTLPPGLTPGLDPLSSPTGQILYYIAGVRHEEPARAFGNPAMDGDPDLEAGAGRRRHLELRRPHDPVPARARSAAAHAVQHLAQERHRCDQRQQLERRRQRAQSRRAWLRDPRHRPRPDARRHRQYRRHPA